MLFLCSKETLEGYGLAGGIMVGTASNPADCLLSCSGPCLAVSYEKADGACVHHHTATHCTAAVKQEDSTIYRTIGCDGEILFLFG